MSIDILLSIIGLTFILKYGSILKRFRCALIKLNPKIFEDLFKCSLCLGFWSGMAHALILIFFYVPISTPVWILPFIGAAISWIADSCLQFIQIAEVKIKKDLGHK